MSVYRTIGPLVFFCQEDLSDDAGADFLPATIRYSEDVDYLLPRMYGVDYLLSRMFGVDSVSHMFMHYSIHKLSTAFVLC